MTTENKAPVSVMSLIGFITVITAPLNSFLFSSGYFQAILLLNLAGLVLSIIGFATGKRKGKSLCGYGLAGIIIAVAFLGIVFLGIILFGMFGESPPQPPPTMTYS
ncbi:MAG: hypothetical protein SPL61_12720 [Saccharofermentans sp.]|nr:hypothetical protein [Saccharofermentans sp.]